MKLVFKQLCILVGLLFFLTSNITAQHVLNGSFEDNTMPDDHGLNLSIFCRMFTENVYYHTTDSLNPVPPGPSHVFKAWWSSPANLNYAPDGVTYVSFTAMEGYNQLLRQLVLSLSGPLVPGKMYTVRYASAALNSTYPLTDVPLTLALGNNRFNASREVDSLQVLDINGYREYAISFVADSGYSYLFFYFKRPVIYMPPPLLKSGAIMIDNIRLDTCIQAPPKRVMNCVSFPLTITALNNGKQVLWNTGDTTQGISVNRDGVYLAHIYDSSGCMFLDSIEVISSPADKNPSSHVSQTICAGDSAELTSPYTGSYVWNTGETVQTIAVTDSASYWVQTTTPGGCVAVDTFKVELQSPPVIPLVADTHFCTGEVIVLDAYNPLFTEYRWNTTSSDSTITISQSGIYSVTASNKICTVKDSVRVDEVNILKLTLDTAFCMSTVLSLKSAQASSYLWNTGETSSIIEVSSPGLYWVQKTALNCTGTDSFIVTAKPIPVITSLKDTTVCFDQVAQILLDAGQFKSYLWKPTGETTRTIYSNTAQVYLLSVTDSNNCSTNKQVAVMETCPEFVFVPNAFTPNGDGLNDVFLPQTRNLVQYEMNIVNRWGEIIFTTKKPEQGWDGKDAPADVYVVQIHYRVDGKEAQTVNANVTLMR